MGKGTPNTLIGGQPAHWDPELEKYRYDSDNSVIEEGEQAHPLPHQPCPQCGLNPKDFGGHDPCIANLPGVLMACCGHGVKEGSIHFENGVVIKGSFRIRKGEPWKPEQQ